MKRLLFIFLAGMMLLGAAGAQAILPQQFNGWQKDKSSISADAAQADATSAAALREYGFQQVEKTAYTRNDRRMEVKAARFADASGAFGAFTFYRISNMQPELIGDKGASANNRVLFHRGNVLVDVLVDRVTAVTATDLKALANSIELPSADLRKLPNLPAYLPMQAFIANSVHYVVGPDSYAGIGPVVPGEVVDFSRGAEIVTGDYQTTFGTGRLMVVSYPTPQIAGDRVRAIEALNLPERVYSKRSGPLVAVVTGKVREDEAKALLASVNYDADITWNERTPTLRDNPANLLVGLIVLTSFLLFISLTLGVAFGGIRVLVKKLWPGKVFDRPESMDIIQLGLVQREIHVTDWKDDS